MCGIAGWYRRGERPVARETIAAQCDRIVHRGPDDSGHLVDRDFGFGMRRLSIIDVEGGHQPITTPDGRYSIVFNGEIYNHLDLRTELGGAGFAFRTRSDTETLLASFVHWRDDAWLRLEGMYAVAVWDHVARTLTLARDPVGIKPLYLTQQHDGIAFASEIRALKALPEHRFDIDERAVHDFFSFGHVQKPRSIYRQVASLDPGHVLHVGPTGAAVRRAFWQPRFRIREGVSESDWIEETRARVLQTVKQHMLADVPVGAFLSGGVDSGAVTAAMTRSTTHRIKAFTIGFPHSAIDETEAARRFAEHLGCEHIVLPMQPMAPAEIFPAVQRSFDEPCAATAAVPIWFLSRLAAQHVKVVLCGEGGDELFAGYKRHHTAQLMQRLRPLFRAMGPVARIVDRLPRSYRNWSYLRQNAVRFRDAALLDSGFQRFFAGTQITSPALRARIYNPAFWQRQDGPGAYAKLEAEYFGAPGLLALPPLQQFLLADLTVHMPGSLLNRLDRASMAHSLEARVPFLSHGFVDWSLTMPLNMKRKGKVGKYALRKAAEPWLPAGALDKRKLGFQLPFAEWFRGDFGDFARDAWHSSGADGSGYLDAAEVEAIAKEHRDGKANHGRILYAITMFSCWWQDQRTSDRTGRERRPDAPATLTAMLIDLREHADAALDECDVCIVGAGAAGITLARRLMQLGHSVCLLESGGLDFEQPTQDLYGGENVGMTYYDLVQSRLRFFGGTLGIWGGRCALLDPIDFERRDWVPHSGWPIGRADLDPYYRVAHDQFELGEFNYEREIWSTLGVTPHAFDPDRLATGLWRFDERSERFGTSRCKDLFDAPNVRIVLHANAVHLQADPAARTLRHIVVRPLAGKTREVAARHYVLACGAIENARLMLASNDVEPRGIGNAHDQVGRYFMEHPTGRIGRVHTARPYEMWDAFQKRFMPSGPPLAPVLRLGDATQRATRALNSVATFKLQRPPALGVPLGNRIYQNLKHGIAPDRRGRALDHAYRGMRAWFHREIRGAFERLRARMGKSGLYLIVRGEQAPNPDSRVRLSDERDALGQRRADLDWQLCDADKHSAKVFTETFDAELRRLGLGSVEPSEWLASPGPEWPVDPTVGNHPIAGYHQMGTTRMSGDPSEGVVTADCNVFGYENLFIAGSSVFSTSGWANPTLTIAALALRLADHLDGRLKIVPTNP